MLPVISLALNNKNIYNTKLAIVNIEATKIKYFNFLLRFLIPLNRPSLDFFVGGSLTKNNGTKDKLEMPAAINIISLKFIVKFQNNKITMIVPIIPPAVSIAWCRPKPLPRFFVETAIIASLGASLNFPILSKPTKLITACQLLAMINKNLNMTDKR